MNIQTAELSAESAGRMWCSCNDGQRATHRVFAGRNSRLMVCADHAADQGVRAEVAELAALLD